MNYVCAICGKSSDETPLYNDWPHDHLEVAMYCWECYHNELIKQNKAGFNLSDIGHNAGWTQDYTLTDAVLSALDENDDNLDMAVGIEAAISHGYMSCMIVRNRQLYLRIADLSFLMDSDDEDEKRALIESLVKQLSWAIQRPIPTANQRNQ